MPVPPPSHAKRVYQSIDQSLWEWDQELYDGSHATFNCCVREDTAAIIPFLGSGNVLLIQEEQPTHSKPFMDVPGGCVDDGETTEDAARRELQEETGYHAGTLELFKKTGFYGKTRFEEHVFLARDLSDGQGPHTDGGERITLKPTPWKDAVKLCLEWKLRRQEVMLSILALEFNKNLHELRDRFLN